MPSSPLAISNIVLSQSERSEVASDATPKASFYRDVLQPNPVPVLLRVRRVRIVGAALALAATVAGVTFVLAQGVTLRTFDDADEIATHTQRHELIQNYNAYVAMAAALCVRPLQLLAALVLPVWLWSFFTETAMASAACRGTNKTKLAIYALSLALVWLLSNATHGLNVQLVFPQPRDRISSGLGFTSIANATKQTEPHADGVDETRVVDSILRSAVTMDYRSTRSACKRASPQRIPAMISYGFPSRSWMAELDTTDSTSQSHVQATLAGEFPSASPLPMQRAAARSLATYAFPLMLELFLSSAEKAASISKNSSAVIEDLWPTQNPNATGNGSDDLWQDINTTFHKFTSASKSARLGWFDVANTNVTIATTNVSSGVVFESVSFEIPFQASYLQRRLTLINNDTTSTVSYNHSAASPNGSLDYYFDINVKEECGERACIVSPRSEKATDAPVDNGPQMHALPICLDSDGHEDIGATLRWNASACTMVSTDSFLVVSFAQRVEGESLNQTSTNVVRLKNAKKYYSVTVGRLRWQTADATEAASSSSSKVASCSNESGCGSVSLRLKEDMAVVADQDTLPLKELLSTSPATSSWTTLVAASTYEIDAGANFKGDLILPSLFASSSPLDVKPTQCEVERGNLLASMETQHWFSLRSDRHAATAALFWLLQDGVVQPTLLPASGSAADAAASTPSASSSAAPGVDVARLELRVPRLSALFAYCGCAIVLLLSVAILLFSKRHESRIEKHFTPFHLAQTLVGASSYPLVPSSALLHSDLLNLGGDLLASSARLRDFDIASLTLQHRFSPGTLIQVPRPPSLTASGSSSTSSFLANV